ncbi:MAG TPA: flagellar motor protein MotD [Burkholderiaceae bacterium]|jgi:chemotaxis protein MotB
MRKPRRKPEDEHENHERWLVSYADFITLLFAFFVVMYSISQVNEGKYKVLANSINAAFHAIPGASAGVLPSTLPAQPIVPPTKTPSEIKLEQMKRQNQVKMRSIAQAIIEALRPLVKDGRVHVTEGAMGITVEINASVLFQPGESHMEDSAVRSMTALGQILALTDFPIKVEGFTDNIPISTAQFPSNWELSGARASSVVRLFIENGVAAGKLTAIGYAEQRPVADNATPEGRMRNRRVAITIESKIPEVVSDIAIPSKE